MFNLLSRYIRDLGYSEKRSIQDNVIAFLKDFTGKVRGSINDLSSRFLSIEGFRGSLNDSFRSWLISKGLAGKAINDLANELEVVFPSDNLLLNMPLRSNVDIVKGSGSSTFNRPSSVATYIDSVSGFVTPSAINEPRFESNGLLMEVGSTNLVLQSEDMSTADWAIVGTLTKTPVSAIPTPDGLTGATTEIEFPDAFASLRQTFAGTNGANKTFSLWVYVEDLGSGGTTLKCQYAAGLGGNVFLDTLPLKTFVRVSFPSLPKGGGSDHINLAVGFPNDLKLRIWGAQFEELGVASSYIPTTTTQVSRDSDSLAISPSGNIPSPSADYSISATYDILGDMLAGDQYLYSIEVIGDPMGTMRDFTAVTTDTKPRVQHADLITSPNLLADNTPLSVAVTREGGTLKLYEDGVNVVTGTADTVFGTTLNIRIGSETSNANTLNGHIKDFRIYDKALTLDEVKSL